MFTQEAASLLHSPLSHLYNNVQDRDRGTLTTGRCRRKWEMASKQTLRKVHFDVKLIKPGRRYC